MVRDLYTNKNNLTDKTGQFQEVFADLHGDQFFFAKNDDAWKTKRKACAHAFYKERLEHMMEVLKD